MLLRPLVPNSRTESGQIEEGDIKMQRAENGGLRSKVIELKRWLFRWANC